MRRDSIRPYLTAVVSFLLLLLAAWLGAKMTEPKVERLVVLGIIVCGLVSAALGIAYLRAKPTEVPPERHFLRIAAHGEIKEEPGAVRTGARWTVAAFTVVNETPKAASLDFALVYRDDVLERTVPSDPVAYSGVVAISLPHRIEAEDYHQFQFTFTDHGARDVPKTAFRVRVTDRVSGAEVEIPVPGGKGKLEISKPPKASERRR